MSVKYCERYDSNRVTPISKKSFLFVLRKKADFSKFFNIRNILFRSKVLANECNYEWLEKGGANSKVPFHVTKIPWLLEKKCDRRNVKFLNPAENSNLALELAWSVQFQSFRPRNRIPPLGCGFDGEGHLESESETFHTKLKKSWRC